jgi:hypothetical protein
MSHATAAKSIETSTKAKNKGRIKRKLSTRQYAAIRLQELIRFREWLEKYGVVITVKDWLFVICHTLAPLKERDGGLDFYHLETCAAAAGIGTEDEAVAMIHKVCDYRAAHPKFRNLSSKTVGKILDVTPLARRECSMSTIDAVGETKEQRKQLRAQDNRKRKELQRRAKGMTPHAESLSRTEPWKAENISRRTWERRRKAAVDANMARHILTLSSAAKLASTIPTSALAKQDSSSAAGQVPTLITSTPNMTLLTSTPSMKQQQKSKISERPCRAETASELRKAA